MPLYHNPSTPTRAPSPKKGERVQADLPAMRWVDVDDMITLYPAHHYSVTSQITIGKVLYPKEGDNGLVVNTRRPSDFPL